MFRSFRVASSRALALSAALAVASLATAAGAQVPPTGGDPTGATGTSSTTTTSSGGTTTTTTTGGTSTTTTTTGGTSTGGDPTGGTSTGGTSTGGTSTGGTSTGGTSTGGTSTGGTSTGGTTTGSPGDITSGDPTGGGTPWGGPGDLMAPPIIDSDLHPCDRPPPGLLKPVNCFSLAEGIIAGEAIDEAGYIVWRVRQLLDEVQDSPTPESAEQKWQAYFGGYTETGSSLQNWFGDYTEERAKLVRGAFEDIWQKYLGPQASGYEVHCGCIAPFDASASAHHWNAHGPHLCESFFEGSWDPLERGALLVHELLHRTKVDGDLIVDAHYGFGCTWDDGAPKCYSAADAVSLAQQSSWEAMHNNSNYEYLGFRWASRYIDGTCNDYSVCSPRDFTAPGCRTEPAEPPRYPDCPDPTNPSNFGTEGCPCADVSIFSVGDAADDGGFADGAGSFLTGGTRGQFCHEPGLVCDTLTKDGIRYPVCKNCKEGAEIGCPCDDDYDCDGGNNLYCMGSTDPGGYSPIGHGTCLPAADPEALTNIPWFCLENCAAVNPYGENGVACIYNQIDPSFGHGTCVNLDGCGGLLPGQCEETGRVCLLDANENDVCVEECSESKPDCQVLGFPDDFVCDALGDIEFTPGHCVPSGCVNSSSEYCNMYR